MDYLLEKPVIASIGTEKYACTIEWRHGKFIVDEPEKAGGKDRGPDPLTLLLSSLAACTLATLRMYIDRKGWEIPELKVEVNAFRETLEGKIITVIDRNLDFLSPVTDEQRGRMIQIAKICPISKILEGDIHINTFTGNEEFQ